MISCRYTHGAGFVVDIEVFTDPGDRVYYPRKQGGEGREWKESEYVFKARCRMSRDKVWGYVGAVSRIMWDKERRSAIRGMGTLALDSMRKGLREESSC